MKKYEIGVVPNPLCRRVSVAKDVRSAVAQALSDLPFVDEAHGMNYEATQIHVLISALAEPDDLLEMEELIKTLVEAE